MLAVAGQFLGGELSLVETARELAKFRHGVEPEIGTLLDVFVGIRSEAHALPIAAERALRNARSGMRAPECAGARGGGRQDCCR
jgi:hypothetical protein